MSLSRVALPNELWDAIIDHLHDDPDALRVAALVCRTWVRTSRFHLFEALAFSPKSALRAACLDALLASPHGTIAPAVRKLSLPETLALVKVRCPQTGAVFLMTLLGLIPHVAQLRHVRDLALSDLAWPLLRPGALSSVERLTLSRMCVGACLIRITAALPRLTHLSLDGVAAVPFRGSGQSAAAAGRMPASLHTVSISGSSIAFLGWLSLAAPHVARLTIDGLASYELDHLAAYLAVLGPALEFLALSFFGTTVDERALPPLLTPCTSLKSLLVHFAVNSEARRFFAFGAVGPWPADMRLEVAVPTGESLEELVHNASVNVGALKA
ncbi:hypothetical protein GGX14DRAFT_676340 [Mycena pura]|uniref:F-box domain-containing protein n=1 Tax=Mycena pura TaxID=153505 RepID=A0AAD6VUX8_9AGAR|nr:hypothetical protein GGX14DRAFT_676340 [Mycena pura]